MDALAGLLEGPRASGAFLLRIILDPPWSIRVQDGSPLCTIAMVSGEGCVVPDGGGDPVWIRPGDVAIIRGPEPSTLAHDPTTEPQVIVHPGQRCETLDGVDLREQMSLGVRTWGGGLDGSVTMLLGVYEEVGAVGQRLLDALPPTLIVSEDNWDSTLISVLGREIAKADPGQEVVLDRLLDLLLITVLRVWFDRPEAEAPSWYHAYGHPVVGQALRLLHDNPEHPWTVSSLAAKVGASRAALARSFAELVGAPPMNYLTEWRLTIAADLLRDSDRTLDSVARKVGYSSGFALSTAFKRVRGISPQEHRIGATAG
jgi:AraC-like DNA-binding protein